MNKTAQDKLRQGIAIALNQFPWLREYDKKSGIYLWYRYDEDGTYCWYVGKAKNLLRRTAQHIVDGQSHLDKSIKKHGLSECMNIVRSWINNSKLTTWNIDILEICLEVELNELEQYYINKWQKDHPNGKMYNVESGGTTGKTIIGERKQRRDVKWKAEAKNKVLADYREYFNLQPKENAYKQNTKELKAKPKQLKEEFDNLTE